MGRTMATEERNKKGMERNLERLDLHNVGDKSTPMDENCFKKSRQERGQLSLKWLNPLIV